MHKVSVIIPAYVVSDIGLSWLNDCLESLADQDCDVVICDDGSPVNITDVTNRWRVTKHVRLSNNRGVSAARNEATRQADTELILPLDCDDNLRPDAISKLLKAWDGHTPVYPDVSKFGDEIVEHFALLDFNCEHIVKHVGFSSVNVLHSVDQWRAIGGWNETIDFYEDGEYNARLFSQYCGVRLPEPLVRYRMHPNQRTKQYKLKSATYARNILSKIRRLEMACKTCGGTRKSITQATSAPFSAPATVNVAMLPGEMGGRVLAHYIGGKGKARHYYSGFVTKFPYKVIYGEYVYADPRDTRDESDTASAKMLVKVAKAAPAPVVVQIPSEPAVILPKPVEQQTTVQRTPRLDTVRTPVLDEASTKPKPAPKLPDINNMTVNDVKGMELTPGLAKRLLTMEKRNKNRAKIIEYLSSKVE